MKKYIVWYEAAEVKTKIGKSWDEHELIDEYHRCLSCNPQTIEEYTSEEEAWERYKSTDPDRPYLRTVSIGTVLEYEVVGIDWIETDEDGGFVDGGTYELKTAPYEGE